MIKISIFLNINFGKNLTFKSNLIQIGLIGSSLTFSLPQSLSQAQLLNTKYQIPYGKITINISFFLEQTLKKH